MSDYKHALITGASSGLGRGLALALAKRGTHIVAAARRKAELDALVTEIRGSGGSAETLVLDCAQADATHDTVRALDQKRPLDLVIANAGIGYRTPAQTLDWKRVKPIFDVNVLGATATLAGALPGMVARGSGHLVGMASLAGYRGLYHSAAYCASKSALMTFLDSLRIDLHGTGVAVTTICPGYVDTDIVANHDGPMPRIMTLDRAVTIMMRALDRKKAVCAFPVSMATVARSGRMLGPSMYDWIARRTKFSA